MAPPGGGTSHQGSKGSFHWQGSHSFSGTDAPPVGHGVQDAWGHPTDAEHTTLELETTYATRMGKDPSNEEVIDYLDHHRLQDFLTDVIMYVARFVPPDPFEFILDHMEAMVMKHRASHGWVSGDSKITASEAESAPAPQDLTAEQRNRIVRHVAAALRQQVPGESSSAAWCFEQFASAPEGGTSGGGGGGGGKVLSEDGFRKVTAHLEEAWSLQPCDAQVMLSALRRARFRANAAEGTRRKSLWPLSRKDFVSAYPSMLRAVRDSYVPIGGSVSRSIFIRRTDGSLGDKYRLGPKLGHGAFGDVFALTSKTNQSVERVCKRVARAQQMVCHEDFPMEIQLLRSLDHPHIIRMFEYFETEMWFDMVIEPVFGGTLGRLLKSLYWSKDGTFLAARPPHLTETWVAQAVTQLLSALRYAHDVAGVIHKDLKPDNVLLVGRPALSAMEQLAEPVHVMLADFGIAELFSEEATLRPEDNAGQGMLPGSEGMIHTSSSSGSRRPLRSIQVGGTPPYMSPEMFKGTFTEKCDIWSLGVIVFEMLSGELPYKADNVLMQANMVCCPRRQPAWDKLTRHGWSLGARWFCQQLLSKDEAMRPSALLAARDVWLAKAASRAAAGADAVGAGPGGLDEAARGALHRQHLQSHLLKMATVALVSQLSLSQMHHLNFEFKHYDASGDGRLGLGEVRQLLLDVGVGAGEEADLVLQSLDGDGSGMVEYSEFIAGCLDLASAGIREQLGTVFAVFDLDGSGSLSLAEISRVLAEGPAGSEPNARRLSEPELLPGAPFGSAGAVLLPDGKTAQQVMRELDVDGSGRVTLSEFEAYLLAEHEQAGQDLQRRVRTPQSC